MRIGVVAFGRMNPPTKGHEKLVYTVRDLGKKFHGEPRIYLSQSHDPKKNPLPYLIKLSFLKKAFGSIIHKSKATTFIDLLKELDSEFDRLFIVAGQDRIKEYQRIADNYNGREFNYKRIEVVSAGERDPDSEGVEGISASKVRKLAADGDFESFSNALPTKLSQPDRKKLYVMIRQNMKAA